VFETGDLAAATDALKRHGIELLWADLPLNAARSSTMLRDPKGNLINNFLAATGCGVRARAGRVCMRCACAGACTRSQCGVGVGIGSPPLISISKVVRA
jgi:hypothetical protein